MCCIALLSYMGVPFSTEFIKATGEWLVELNCGLVVQVVRSTGVNNCCIQQLLYVEKTALGAGRGTIKLERCWMKGLKKTAKTCVLTQCTINISWLLNYTGQRGVFLFLVEFCHYRVELIILNDHSKSLGNSRISNKNTELFWTAMNHCFHLEVNENVNGIMIGQLHIYLLFESLNHIYLFGWVCFILQQVWLALYQTFIPVFTVRWAWYYQTHNIKGMSSRTLVKDLNIHNSWPLDLNILYPW